MLIFQNLYQRIFLCRYDRNSLMTWCDHGQSENFSRDIDKHFREAKIINFDIIQTECWAEEVLKDLLPYYQAVRGKRVSEYLASDQEKILSSALRTHGKDIFFEQKTIKRHFNKKFKTKSVLLHTNSFKYELLKSFYKMSKIWVVTLFYFIL